MKQLVMAGIVGLAVFSLAGCDQPADYEGSIECKTGGECTIKGSVKGRFSIEKSTLAASIIASGGVFDAAQFNMNLAGSTVGVPSAGLVTIRLVDSRNGITQAARVFPWNRTGGTLALAGPDGVNAWIISSGGSADSLAYELHPFQTSGQAASNVLAVAIRYEGQTRASSSVSMGGGGCRVGVCSEQ